MSLREWFVMHGDLTILRLQRSLFQPVTSLLNFFLLSAEPQGEIQTISYGIQGSHLPFQSCLSIAFSLSPNLSIPLALTPSLCTSLLHLSESCSSDNDGPGSELSECCCVFHISSSHSLPYSTFHHVNSIAAT